MAWGDPATDTGQSWYDLSGTGNDAIRQALLAFGTNMMANAHRPRLQGVGESIGAGFGAYQAAARKAKLDAMLAAGHSSPIGVPLGEHARDPGFRAAYDLPLGTPVPTRLESGAGTAPPPGWQYTPSYTGTGPYTTPGTPPPGGPPPGTTLYRPGTSIPTPEALAAGSAASPGAPAAPGLPQSPFGPGPWGTTPPIDPNAIAPTDPRQPNSMVWNPQSAYENVPGAGGLPLPPTPATSTIPYVAPGPGRPGAGAGPGRGVSAVDARRAAVIRALTPAAPALSPTPPSDYVPPPNEWSSAAPGLFNLAGGGVPGAPSGAVSRETMAGGADRDVLANAPLWQRNNNPGNLHYAGQAGAESGDKGFARFSSLEEGVAATKRQLALYGKGSPATGGRPLNTLRQIISTYSPKDENDTEKLIENASARMGVGPNDPLDMSDSATLDKLTNVITQQETGRTVGDLGVSTAAPTRGGTQVAGGEARTAMAGGAEQDVPQSNVARMSAAGVPEWKMAGLLEQAGAGDTGGMYDAQGNLSEDTKRTLRLANAAGGSEGVMQMLGQMANAKPETFGNAETGYYLRHPNGKIEQLLAPQTKAKEQWQEVTDPEYIKKHPLDPGLHWERNAATQEVKPVGNELGQPGGVKIEMPPGESEQQRLHAKRVDASTAEADTLRKNMEVMEPAAATLREAVLRGDVGKTGPLRAMTLPLRQAMVGMGLLDPNSTRDDEWMDSQSKYLTMHAKAAGAGAISDYERDMLIKAGIALGNTVQGNYVIMRGLQNMHERQARIAEAQGEYFNGDDPKTGKPRNSLVGFEKWWRTDPNGDAAQPRVFYDFSPSGRDKDMSDEDFSKLPAGTIYMDDNGAMQIKKRS